MSVCLCMCVCLFAFGLPDTYVLACTHMDGCGWADQRDVFGADSTAIDEQQSVGRFHPALLLTSLGGAHYWLSGWLLCYAMLCLLTEDSLGGGIHTFVTSCPVYLLDSIPYMDQLTWPDKLFLAGRPLYGLCYASRERKREREREGQGGKEPGSEAGVRLSQAH
mmetsp:Transcript_8450/g.24050  ORF Transcript_8450/g.24050 Transcript_8450/m.24050 type:complete len:164 (-) Transcript_8450:151-642(-)